jgi:ABC transporter substrate binding protein
VAARGARAAFAVAGLEREPNGGVLVMPDAFTLAHRELIITLAARHRLPAIYPFAVFTKSGGLLSYGIDQVEFYRRAAAYVDRILKGEKPADLPVQAPTKFELVVNLKTAKALGIEIPDKLLARAGRCYCHRRNPINRRRKASDVGHSHRFRGGGGPGRQRPCRQPGATGRQRHRAVSSGG